MCHGREFAEALISLGVKYIVTTTAAVVEETAVKFFVNFIAILLRNRCSVCKAFEEALRSIRSRDHGLFDVLPKGPHLSEYPFELWRQLQASDDADDGPDSESPHGDGGSAGGGGGEREVPRMQRSPRCTGAMSGVSHQRQFRTQIPTLAFDTRSGFAAGP
jgi:hypothetical protein